MFPNPEHTREIVNILGYHFDDHALNQVLEALPDAVVSRITHMVDLKLQPRIYKLLGNRVDRLGVFIERESEADREKDIIVQNAVTKLVNQLIKQGRIVEVGLDYAGKDLAAKAAH
jgi:Asp-tRNA(Asn)/Glu-tRNA(Gln) amidotransferase A subunit family amidase